MRLTLVGSDEDLLHGCIYIHSFIPLFIYFLSPGGVALLGVSFCIVFCEATVSEHTMLLEGACSRPPPKEANTGPVSGVEIMRKLSKSHTHNESALRIKVSVHSGSKDFLGSNYHQSPVVKLSYKTYIFTFFFFFLTPKFTSLCHVKL